jgi:polyisoprenoid-binding protein YceI
MALWIVVATTCLAAPTLSAQEIVVTLDPVETRIEFTLGATLHTVHGSFKLKSGTIRLDQTSGKASGTVVVDSTSGESGSAGRDKKMHQEILESQKFSEIVFTPNQVKGTLSPGGVYQYEVSGIFRLHGEDHELTFTVVVQPGGRQVQASTHFIVPYVRWGLKNPSTFILRVNDKVEIDVHVVGQMVPAADQK